jgi:hypothetical protein
LLWSLALVLGLVLLVIPGIIVAITLSLVWCGVVLENLGPVNALKRSHHLVWPGEWWRTFVIVSVPMVILFTAILALYIPLEFIKDLVRSNTVMSVIQNIGEVIIYTLTTPMLYAVLIALYHDLKLRREGSDLFRRIEAANAVAS